MMKTFFVIIVVAVFLVLGSLPTSVYAQHHGGFRGGGHLYGGHFGGPRGFGFFYYDPYWYYPYYYPYGYYYPPFEDTQPPVYIEPEQPSYWYYCLNPEGYYPYITNCPGGWMRVVPTPPAPGGEVR
ncbi:MAG TPA: hypothetical protein VMT62_00100 [Syntrophorhabdaceae bacterium]|nr:hypothetical protein [Syntrophorhabdaceae bacterium]